MNVKAELPVTAFVVPVLLCYTAPFGFQPEGAEKGGLVH